VRGVFARNLPVATTAALGTRLSLIVAMHAASLDPRWFREIMVPSPTNWG
jgi:hypothetical protein